jgi:hypothetical protein
MPRAKQTPVAVQDAALAKAIAKVVLDNLDSAVSALEGYNNVIGVEVTPGLNGPASAMLRVTINHDRGPRVHMYTLRLTEMTL